MTRVIEKRGRLELTDEEYNILIDILNVLPTDMILCSQLIGLRQNTIRYLLPEEVLELLEKVEEVKKKRPGWKPVLDKFLAFKRENLILL